MKYQESIERVTGYIQHNLDKDMSLDHLSIVAAMSKFHFHRIFRVYKGISVIKFIQLSRLKRASYQLAFEHQIKIIDIALQAKFDSAEAFSRAFKRSFEQTPSNFRKSPDWHKWHELFRSNNNTPKNHRRNQIMDVNITKRDQEKIAFVTHRGEPNLVLETASKFIAWRKETGLSPIKSSNTYGIPHSDPKATPSSEFRFEICGSVDKEVPENIYGVTNGTLPGGRYAVIRHKGSHDDIEISAYYLYKEWLPKSGEEVKDQPIFFHYLNFIHDVDECDLLTDIYLALK